MTTPAIVRTLPIQQGGIAPPSGGRVVTGAGELTQLIAGNIFRHLAYLEFKASGAPRGNHYHRVKHEFVYVMSGHLEVVSVNLDTNEKQTITMRAGDLLESPPMNAHVFIAKEDTMALEFAAQPYNPEDTIPYKVV